jgi:hypothetical protein
MDTGALPLENNVSVLNKRMSVFDEEEVTRLCEVYNR